MFSDHLVFSYGAELVMGGVGSLLGGFVGARLALALPPAGLRIAVVLIGVGTAIRLLA